MKRYRLDPKNLPRLTPEEERRLDEAVIDYSDIPPLGEEFFSQAIRPNRETIEAIKAAERGEVTTVGHPRNLVKSLNDPIMANPKAVAEIALRAFARATRAAIEENDRLGIPSYGGKDGKIVVRQPRRAKTASQESYETPPLWGDEWYREVSAACCLARELESLRRLYGPDWPRKPPR